MDDISKRVVGWPTERRVYFTLDLECDFGTALQQNTYQALEHVPTLVALLEEHNLPITCFVQTEVLGEKPEAVERLRTADTTVVFHPHSHTHRPRDKTSVASEIKTSTSRFRDYFDTKPIGYRFPNGNIRPTDYARLASQDYEFDASIFPSWRPNQFNNVTSVKEPYYLDNFDLLEIPFTVYAHWLPIPTALSYLQLLGWPFQSLVMNYPRPPIVFNIHMHDLVMPSSVEYLPEPYHFVYKRNTNGIKQLRDVIESFREHNLRFGIIDDVYHQIQEPNQ